MNKHSTVLDVRIHAGDLVLRRRRREKEERRSWRSTSCHFCSPSVLDFFPSHSTQHTHTSTPAHSLSDEGECCVHHTEGLLYSCERLLCKTKARLRCSEVSSQLRTIIPLSVFVCLCMRFLNTWRYILCRLVSNQL